MGNTASTEINTFIRLQEPTVSKKFKPYYIIKIGNEEILISVVDDLNNKYNVVRKHNNVETAHNVNSEVNKLPQEFTFDVKEKLENKNIEPKIELATGLMNYVGVDNLSPDNLKKAFFWL